MLCSNLGLGFVSLPKLAHYDVGGQQGIGAAFVASFRVSVWAWVSEVLRVSGLGRSA